MRAFPVFLLLIAGCVPEEKPAPLPAPEPAPNRHEPARAGSIEGVVRWVGPVPKVPPFRSVEFVGAWEVGPKNRLRDFPNPAAPQVNEGLAGAVVFVRLKDPSKARPWDHEPLSAHLNGLRLVLKQGGREGTVGIARLGEKLPLFNEEDVLHTIQGRGASFFGLTVPRKGERKWILDKPGLCEIRSGAGFFWMRGFVFVAEHACVAITDHRGRFRIDGVPEGPCEVVVLHPDWRVREEERNQDSVRVTRVSFGTPLEGSATARVETGTTAKVELRLGDPP